MTATQLVGPRPTGSVRAVSLAAAACLQDAHKTASQFLIACSGGADSLALTVAAADWLTRHQIFPRAVIIDHQLRPTSASEARETSQLLDSLEIANTVIPVEVTAGAGLEAAAREARYQALRAYATQTFPGQTVGILLGHTLDDQAETVLLGLARGAGARAIAGMRPHWTETRGAETLHFYRPLIHSIRRTDTEGFCQQLNLPYVNDPTNFLDGPWRSRAGDPLPRVGLRHTVLPELSKALHQDVVPALARTARLVAADAEFIEEYALDRFHSGEIYAGGEVLVDALGKEKLPVRMRLWKLIFAAHSSAALTSCHLEELDRLLTDWRGQGPVSLPGGWTARREKLVTRENRAGKWHEHVHRRIVLAHSQ